MNETKPAALNDYDVAIAQNLNWGEMDAFQHINNVRYFRYFENVRMTLFVRTQMIDENNQVGEVGPILKSTSCHFKAPLVYPDRIWIAARITNVQEDNFLVEHALYSTKLKRIAAVGEGVIVSYNYKTLKKATIPERWLENFKRLKDQRTTL